MGWKEWPGWIKGGIWGLIFVLLVYLAKRIMVSLRSADTEYLRMVNNSNLDMMYITLLILLVPILIIFSLLGKYTDKAKRENNPALLELVFGLFGFFFSMIVFFIYLTFIECSGDCGMMVFFTPVVGVIGLILGWKVGTIKGKTNVQENKSEN